MKDTLEYLGNNPQVGISSSIGGSMLHWLEIVNPLISFLGMLVGLAVGIVTLTIKIKELLK